MRKTILLERPSLILATLGGAAGVLFSAAALAVAGTAGAPPMGLTEALGGPWLGSILAFLGGWLVLPLLMVASWNMLPGHAESLPGALLKGALFGVVVWALTGVLLGVAGAPGGWLGGADGIGGVVALLVAALGYGLVTAAIASMGRGMAPLHTAGWEGHSAGRAG